MHNRIRKLRLEARISVREAAFDSGCTPVRYLQYERGQKVPALKQTIRFAMLFETSIDYLVGLTEERVPYPTHKKTSLHIRREVRRLD